MLKTRPALFILTALFASSGAAAQESASTQLERLFADAWEFTLQENPLFATRVGDRRFNDRLPTVSVDDYQRRLDAQKRFLERLDQIDPSALSKPARTDYDIFKRLTADAISELEFKTYLIPITNRSGFHVSFPQLPKRLTLRTVEDYTNYVARLDAFRRYTDQHVELMRAGSERGLTLPSVVVKG